MTIDVRRVDDDVHRNATTMKQWAPFGPPDEFDVADATLPVSYVLAKRGARGGCQERELEEYLEHYSWWS
jgi:hypothetical protein